MTSPAHTGSAEYTTATNHPRTPAIDPVAVENTPVVHWPEPSPLHHWWTEIMDGALTPATTAPPRS